MSMQVLPTAPSPTTMNRNKGIDHIEKVSSEYNSSWVNIIIIEFVVCSSDKMRWCTW